MRRQTTPPAISSTIGASPSTSELTALAPIASPVSTMTWTTTIVSPRGVSHQPHLDVARAGAALAQAGRELRRRRQQRGARRVEALDRAAPDRARCTSWIWPIMAPGSASAAKPPPARATSAAFEAAAMTDGSSTTIGMT